MVRTSYFICNVIERQDPSFLGKMGGFLWSLVGVHLMLAHEVNVETKHMLKKKKDNYLILNKRHPFTFTVPAVCSPFFCLFYLFVLCQFPERARSAWYLYYKRAWWANGSTSSLLYLAEWSVPHSWLGSGRTGRLLTVNMTKDVGVCVHYILIKECTNGDGISSRAYMLCVYLWTVLHKCTFVYVAEQVEDLRCNAFLSSCIILTSCFLSHVIIVSPIGL